MSIKITLTTVAKSSNVNMIGYDKENKQLYVVYHDGGAYRYDGVSHPMYKALEAAPSKGGYLAAKIKGIKSYVKVSPAKIHLGKAPWLEIQSV